MVIDENVIVYDQKEILKQIKQFYGKLYKKQDCLKKVNLSTEIPYNEIPKLTENQKQSLEGEISLPELTSTLKRMKNKRAQYQMALPLTSLNFSGLIWENLSSDLLMVDINKEKCLLQSDRE